MSFERGFLFTEGTKSVELETFLEELKNLWRRNRSNVVQRRLEKKLMNRFEWRMLGVVGHWFTPNWLRQMHLTGAKWVSVPTRKRTGTATEQGTGPELWLLLLPLRRGRHCGRNALK